VSAPFGWGLRVWVGVEESDDPAYDTALYIARYPTSAEAEAAVRRFRGKTGERIEVLGPETFESIPPLQPGEVRRLRGAV
jgi:hypothetical protein